MESPLVFAIIVSYNLKNDTLECLESMQQVTYPNLHTVLVDNASSDGTVSAVRSLHPEVTIIEAETNLSYFGGNNLGIEYALNQKADYVFILNNDMIVDPLIIEVLVRVATQYPDAGMICPKVYEYDRRNVIWSAGVRIDMTWGRPYLIGHGEEDRGQQDDMRPADTVDGCAFLVSRRVCESVGLFDSIYWAYFEDTDWSLRCREMGFDILYAPEGRGWHKGSATNQPEKKRTPFQAYYHIRNHLLFLSRHSRISILKHLEVVAMIGFNLGKAAVGYQRKVSLARIRGLLDYYRGRFGKTLSLDA